MAFHSLDSRLLRKCAYEPGCLYGRNGYISPSVCICVDDSMQAAFCSMPWPEAALISTIRDTVALIAHGMSDVPHAHVHVSGPFDPDKLAQLSRNWTDATQKVSRCGASESKPSHSLSEQGDCYCDKDADPCIPQQPVLTSWPQPKSTFAERLAEAQT